jgi:hypothetical protein
MELLTPEQQLQHLNQQYEERRQTAPEHESEKETMSRMLEQQIQQHEPTFSASSHEPRPADTLSGDEQSRVQELVTESFPPSGKGVWAAIKAAKATGDMALLDAFHGALSGELYNHLVESKQIKEVS